jgi:acetyl esterase/lipase
LRAAGAPSELYVWPEAPHGFISLPMTFADAALAAEHDFLRRTLRLKG